MEQDRISRDISKMIEKELKAAPEQSRETLSAIVKGITDAVQNEQARQEKILEDNEKSRTYREMKERIEALEKENRKLQSQMQNKEIADGLKTMASNTKEIIHMTAQKAVDICKNTKQKVFDQIKDAGHKFMESAYKARQEHIANREMQKDIKAYEDQKITVEAQKELYKTELEYRNGLIRNNEQAVEKLYGQRERLEKTYEQINDRVSLIANGFRNLANAFKGQEAKTVQEADAKTHLFSEIREKLKETIDKNIDRYNTEMEEHHKKIPVLEAEIDSADRALNALDQMHEEIMERYGKKQEKEQSLDDVIAEANMEASMQGMEQEGIIQEHDISDDLEK